jgi:protoporphyrin/coproporphyrin ferrochelatase
VILRRITLAFRTVPRARGRQAPRCADPGLRRRLPGELEEIGVENAEYFHGAGGEKFAALPYLDDSDEGMAVLEAIARRELAGWV